MQLCVHSFGAPTVCFWKHLYMRACKRASKGLCVCLRECARVCVCEYVFRSIHMFRGIHMYVGFQY